MHPYEEQVSTERQQTNAIAFWSSSRGVCFSETFQTFLCLFAIRKVGQRKTLSGQRKILSSQRKIWLGFQESVFLLFWAKNTFRKL